MAQSVLTAKQTSSKSDVWGTPPELAVKLVKEFNLQRDVAASSKNKKCHYYLGPDHTFPGQHNALTIPWYTERCFLNPPFSLINEFVEKVLEEVGKGALVVAVMPAKTETKWWHKAVPSATEVRFLRGRLNYWEPNEEGEYEAGDPALFPSCVIIWDGTKPQMTGGPRFTFWDWRNAERAV